MHILVISLLTILAGTLLLAKTKKDMPGKFFHFISWFFIIVGFVLFLGFIGGAICKMSHHDLPCQQDCRHEMMMKGFDHGMKGCCPQTGMGMEHGNCPKMPGCCMHHDSTMKCCPKHMKCDSTKMCVPKK
jgi:hypothetical protein